MGAESYQLSVELPSAANLVDKSEVKVDDVTVGTVTGIDLVGWHAVVTVSLEGGVELPANAEARVGQKSLLGAEYLELSAPATGQSGRLRDGDRIPLARSGNFPETEELLAAMSALLNGGGLATIRTIVSEVNIALADGGANASRVLRQLAELAETISSQRRNIEAVISDGDELAHTLADRTDDIERSLEQISDGMAVLDRERDEIVSAIHAVDEFASVGNRLVSRDGEIALADVQALNRVLGKLAEAADALPYALDTLGTVLFPVSSVKNVVKGDYLNVSATIDLTIQALAAGLFPLASDKEALELLLKSFGLAPPEGALTTSSPGVGAVAVDKRQSPKRVVPTAPQSSLVPLPNPDGTLLPPSLPLLPRLNLLGGD